MIQKAIIKRKKLGLRRTENGAFDIPTITASIAIDYFSGSISLQNAKKKLREGGWYIGYEEDEIVVAELKGALNGNERFFCYLNENASE